MQDASKLMLTQLAMAQFEKVHGPVQVDEDRSGITGVTIICEACQEDWPCERMGVMLISQALAMLQQMIPSGGMGSLLSRLSQSPR